MALCSTANEATCQQYGVQGYPTIKFFGKNKRSPEDYNGGRDSGSIVQFATQHWAKSAPPPEVTELVDQHAFDKVCEIGGMGMRFRLSQPNITVF